jgi:hypothetical protein
MIDRFREEAKYIEWFFDYDNEEVEGVIKWTIDDLEAFDNLRNKIVYSLLVSPHEGEYP